MLTVLTHKHWLPVRCRRLVPGAVVGHGVRLGGGTIRDVNDREFVKNKFQLFCRLLKIIRMLPLPGGRRKRRLQNPPAGADRRN